MIQLLSPSWWLSFAGEVWPWWLACVVLGLLAWPLTVRVFASQRELLAIAKRVAGTLFQPKIVLKSS